MKELYIDIMEKAVRVYKKARIDRYIDEVRKDGLTEHGFPRLAANLAIVISFGRCTELYPEMVKMLDICCAEMPKKKADCIPTICLSVPFPAPEAKYKPEKENVRPMSLCVYADTNLTQKRRSLNITSTETDGT